MSGRSEFERAERLKGRPIQHHGRSIYLRKVIAIALTATVLLTTFTLIAVPSPSDWINGGVCAVALLIMEARRRSAGYLVRDGRIVSIGFIGRRAAAVDEVLAITWKQKRYGLELKDGTRLSNFMAQGAYPPGAYGREMIAELEAATGAQFLAAEAGESG